MLREEINDGDVGGQLHWGVPLNMDNTSDGGSGQGVWTSLPTGTVEEDFQTFQVSSSRCNSLFV